MVKLEHVDFVAYGICTLSVVPVRLKPDARSEMVTQLLFGQCFNVFDLKRKNWIKIQIISDKYIGWINHKQCQLIDYNEMREFSQNYAVSIELNHLAFANEHSINLAFGSHLPRYDGMSFTTSEGKFSFSGQAIFPTQVSPTKEYVTKIARKFMYSPHMFGGKSCFGLDSSGFIQLIFKAFGQILPRDSMDQMHFGENVDFIEQSQTGDLAFFENKTGQIHHVGMILEKNQIIHVFGCVRVDHIDHNGIYIRDRRSYTHRLRIVKRLLNFKSSED